MPEERERSNPISHTIVRKDGSTAQSYGAARGYSRPPFRAGNMANLRHGAFSERVISDVAVLVAEELLELDTPEHERADVISDLVARAREMSQPMTEVFELSG